ncbi:MAG: Uma2 family endonuclease [Myxococcales bacterium]|nr:Uma2 family endonuclease [Myxococcales bacterium]
MDESFEQTLANAPSVSEETRILLRGVDWKQFQHWLRMRADNRSVHIAYREGDLELMAPSYGHEVSTYDISILVTAWSEVTGTELSGCGSWTIQDERAKRGVEPDSCFIVGPREERPPDIAIEVIWTKPLLDRLDIYWHLGVREVWCWKRSGGFDVFARRRRSYARVRGSELLPDLDLELLAKHVGKKRPILAAKAYRAALRKRAGRQ